MNQYISAENPLGVIKIDHIEFTTATPSELGDLFFRLGFTLEQDHQCPKHDSFYYRQNDMNLIVTQGKKESVFQYEYFQKHGQGVCTLAFLVESAEHALNEAIKRGATKAQDLKVNELEGQVYKTAAINGFGDLRNLFVERSGTSKRFAPQFTLLQNPHKPTDDNYPNLLRIDHLTNNVYAGNMEKYAQFYKEIYGFIEVRYFDIKGFKTGLFSKVVCSPNREVIIPINEPDDSAGYSQIQEYLDMHKGEGVQHIAMTTNDIVNTIKMLRKNGFEFLTIPKTYYELLEKRLPSVIKKENMQAIQEESILVDGDEKEYLLQIFTSNQIGPLFFEIICRKGHSGFGEGNFQALFDSIELDQQRRGVLK